MKLNIIEGLNTIAKIKNLDKDVVLDTLKESLATAAQKKTGIQKNIEVEIDEVANLISLYLRVTVVDDYPDVDDSLTALEVAKFDEKYMLIEEARQYNEDVVEGDFLEMEIPIEDFGRMAINTTKQVLLHRIRDARREQIFSEFKHKEGDIITGTVEQVDRGNIFVNFGDRVEAIFPGREQIRKERFRQGDVIKALVLEVNQDNKEHQIVLSRAHPLFLEKLFEVEVPEISDGSILIHSTARDPGFRAKIAVSAKDDNIDPVGSCVGLKGNRVQAIVRELSNERIDIINYSSDQETYIKRVLSPVEILEIHDVDKSRVVIIIEDENLAQAIGRGGQNVRLASKLVGKELDIYGQTEFNQMSEEEKTELFTKVEEDDIEDDSNSNSDDTGTDKFSELNSLFK